MSAPRSPLAPLPVRIILWAMVVLAIVLSRRLDPAAVDAVHPPELGGVVAEWAHARDGGGDGMR